MDYLIIGAGPAGLQLGYFLEQAGRDYLILEAGAQPGTFFTQYPRHRTLISINKPHTGVDDPEMNLRMDWNSLLSDDPSLRFTQYSAKYFPPAAEMVRYLADFASVSRLRIQYNTRVHRISREKNFVVTDEHGQSYTAKRLILATGVSEINVPAIPGIEFAERYSDMPVDPAGFVNQRVLIIGKGNSAFETADNLMESAAVIHVAGPSAIRLAWRTHFVGHLRAVNNNFLDSYQLKSQNALLDGTVVRIERTNEQSYRVTFRFSRADETEKELVYDRVILCAGFRFASSIFEETLRPELTINDRFPAQTAAWESTNIPDLYFAGTLMQARDYKRSTSGFVHGFRYGVRALHHILEQRYEGVSWPSVSLPADPGSLTEAVLARANRTSALWQQFGFLCDMVSISTDGAATYLQELPVDLVTTTDLGKADCCFLITLEYGPNHDQVDPFDISVRRIAQNSAEEAHEAQYLHPVVRWYASGQLVATHHVSENLENEWNGPAHHRPLQAFFARALSGGKQASVASRMGFMQDPTSPTDRTLSLA